MEGVERDNQISYVNRGPVEVVWIWTASADRPSSKGDGSSMVSLALGDNGKAFFFCFDAGRNSMRNERKVHCL